MFNVTIYEKDGKRHLYDHVSQITNISDNVVIDFITDFGDQLTKTLNKDKLVLIRKESTTKGGQKMAKAYINGTEVTVYEYRGEEALCYIPALDIKGWYKQNLIEVRHD